MCDFTNFLYKGKERKKIMKTQSKAMYYYKYLAGTKEDGVESL